MGKTPTYKLPAFLLSMAMVLLHGNTFGQANQQVPSHTDTICFEEENILELNITWAPNLDLAEMMGFDKYDHIDVYLLYEGNITKMDRIPGDSPAPNPINPIPDRVGPLFDCSLDINNCTLTQPKNKKRNFSFSVSLPEFGGFNLSRSFQYLCLYAGGSLATQTHVYPDIGFNSEKLLPGLSAGLDACFSLTEKVCIIPSFGYTQKGGIAHFYRIYSKPTNQFDYLHFGLPLQFRLYQSNKYMMYGQFGPQVNFLLKDDIEYDVDQKSGNFKIEIHKEYSPYTSLTDTPYPDNSRYKDFKPYKVGWTTAFCTIIHKKWKLEISYKMDDLINQPDFRVRDHYLAVSLGYVLGMK